MGFVIVRVQPHDILERLLRAIELILSQVNEAQLIPRPIIIQDHLHGGIVMLQGSPYVSKEQPCAPGASMCFGIIRGVFEHAYSL